MAFMHSYSILKHQFSMTAPRFRMPARQIDNYARMRWGFDGHATCFYAPPPINDYGAGRVISFIAAAFISSFDDTLLHALLISKQYCLAKFSSITRLRYKHFWHAARAPIISAIFILFHLSPAYSAALLIRFAELHAH